MEEKETNNTENHTAEQSPTQTEGVEEKSTGAIIGIIIIVVLLVIGGIYYIETRSSHEPAPTEQVQTPKEIQSSTNNIVKSIEKQGTSDKINDIQKDLNNTNFKNIDVDLGKINSELGK